MCEGEREEGGLRYVGRVLGKVGEGRERRRTGEREVREREGKEGEKGGR